MTIAAFVLGIIALLLAFIPLIGTFAICPAILGFLLGIIGLLIKIKRKQPKAIGIVGVILCGLAIVVSKANFEVSDKAIKQLDHDIREVDQKFQRDIDKIDQDFKRSMEEIKNLD